MSSDANTPPEQPENASNSVSIEQDLRLAIGAMIEREVSEQVVAVRQEFHSGPLPSSKEFLAYDAVVSGAADRILAMAEKEQAMRLEGQRSDAQARNDIIDKETAFKKRGQTIGGLIGGCCIMLAAYCAYLGAVWGAVAIVGAIAGVAYVFISGEAHKDKLDEKEQDGMAK